MVVQNEESTEFANVFTTQPVVMNQSDVWGGRLRVARFTHDQVATADALSDVKLVKLPAGRITILGALCKIYVNWTTASATIDLGYDAYINKAGATIAADPNAFDDGVAVDTAGAIPLGTINATTAEVFEFETQKGLTILATMQDNAGVIGDDITGYIVYIAE